MNGWLLALISILLIGLAVLLWRWMILRGLFRASEGRRTAIEGEEHRMFDFLHLLGAAIDEERSLSHLYRTIVTGVEEVLNADGAALYLIKNDELVAGHLSERCPALIEVPEAIREKEGDGLTAWLRLKRVPLAGETLEKVLDSPAGVWWTEADEIKLPGVANLMAIPIWRGRKAVGVLAATRKEMPFADYDWDTFRSMAEQSSFALGNAMLHKEVQEKKRLDDELRTAREVQRVLLPEKNPDWVGYRVRGMNLPARLISGDYFDYLELADGQHGVIIADVSGKGVGAGLVMASCRSALRAFVESGLSATQTLAALNRLIFRDIQQDMFVSAAYAVLENGSGKLTLIRAGHDAPLLYRKASGEVEILKPGGLALGIDKGPVFERVTKVLELQMDTGDVLLFYTDGITEAENRKGEEFGKNRLRDVLKECGNLGAEEILLTLEREVRQFAPQKTRNDDMTLVAIERI